jgi:zinc and cadmium transporter
MSNNYWIAFAASTLAAAVTSFGIFTIRRYTEWGRSNTIYFICFASGVLISASFLHIVPKSFTMNPAAPFYLLAGFFSLLLFNRFVTAFICEKGRDEKYGIGLVPMLGIGFHSFIDGIVYSITFTVSIFTGALAAVGMVLHEFPEGIITYLLLIRSGFRERKAVWLAFLAAALSTPLGTLVSYPLINLIDASLLGALLALSAGALIYVGATHLLPQAEKESKRYSLLAFLAGIAVAVLIVMTKG